MFKWCKQRFELEHDRLFFQTLVRKLKAKIAHMYERQKQFKVVLNIILASSPINQKKRKQVKMKG